MASVWGKSWGKSWGTSWGNIGLVPDTSYVVNGTRLTNSVSIPRFGGLVDTRFAPVSPSVSKVSVIFSDIITAIEGLPRYFEINKDNRNFDITLEIRLFVLESNVRFFEIFKVSRIQEVISENRCWLVPPQTITEIEI